MTANPAGKIHRLALTGCALTALFAACRSTASDGEDSARPVVTVKTALARVEPFTHTTSAIGTVVGRPGHYAALSAPSPTRVARVYVSEGQRVDVGQPLVEFEQMGFDAAASAAAAALTAAQRTAERAERLANEGIVPRKDAEAATAELGRAQADAVAARRAQQLSVLRSPVTGVVTRMGAVLGAPADAGQVLVEVADPAAFDVVLSLGPAEASALLPGAHVDLSAGERTDGESLGTGRIASVGAAVDSGSRAVPIRVTVAAPRRALRLGETVYGRISAGTQPNAVVVPVEALVPGDAPGSYRLFVVDRTGTALARDVKVGGRTESSVEITGGLAGGETVVTQGAFGVEDSAKVALPLPVKP
jgi:cobalt-zinc-cadmium efflux system membrane fusion protein